ncbi:MAG: hypothetical protein NTY64_10095 [Deltaproteobacteria bacterium]|nr:hypothetical protein [Deltaproteobacteria bacterium]
MGVATSVKFDGFVKSPSAALRCILRRCGVPPSTPHSSGFARLASGVFYFAIHILTFYEFIKFGTSSEILRFSKLLKLSFQPKASLQ